MWAWARAHQLPVPLGPPQTWNWGKARETPQVSKAINLPEPRQFKHCLGNHFWASFNYGACTVLCARSVIWEIPLGIAWEISNVLPTAFPGLSYFPTVFPRLSYFPTAFLLFLDFPTFLQVFLDFPTFLWLSLDFPTFLFFPRLSYGFSYFPMGFPWLSYVPTAFLGFLTFLRLFLRLSYFPTAFLISYGFP